VKDADYGKLLADLESEILRGAAQVAILGLTPVALRLLRSHRLFLQLLMATAESTLARVPGSLGLTDDVATAGWYAPRPPAIDRDPAELTARLNLIPAVYEVQQTAHHRLRYRMPTLGISTAREAASCD
jgi:hypothetical protein